MVINSTTNQGPSSQNQTSDDHSSNDSNQDERVPSIPDVLREEGIEDQVPAGAEDGSPD